MDIKELLEQLVSQLDEQRAELFLEEIERADDDVSVDELIAMFESISSLDEEQLDELKKETLKNYQQKAGDQIVGTEAQLGRLRDDYAWGGYKDKELGDKIEKLEKKYGKRVKGFGAAYHKLREEEELSAETYKKFEKANAAAGAYPGAESKHNAMADKAKAGHDDNEETDLEKQGYEKYFQGKSTKLADFAAKLNAKAREHVKDPQAIKEDLEQIDELKKETLGSYIKKSSDDLGKNKFEAGLEFSGKMGKLKKALDTSAKRSKGIKTASDKLVKGDFQESFDFSSDLAAIFEGQEFSEEFKEKAAFILETAIKAQFSEAVDAYEEALLESVSEMVIEELETIQEELENQVSGYLNHIVEEYLTENELAIDHGLRIDLAESIMTGIKGVLLENNIDVPEEKINLFEETISEKETILESVISEKEQIEALYQKEVDSVISLKEEVESLKKVIIAEGLSEGLTVNDKSKLMSLLEEVEADSAEDFLRKASLIKETYHKKPNLRPSRELISEDFDDEVTEEISIAPDVEIALAALDRFKTK